MVIISTIISTNLSLGILATVPLDHGKCTEAKQISKSVDLEGLPIIYTLREVPDRRSQMFFVNRIVSGVKDILNSVDSSGDVDLEVRRIRLLAKFL